MCAPISTPSRCRKTLESFREGRTNVLLATTVAEEGIDVQSVEMVVRMEPPAFLTAVIQSRGRARFPERLVAAWQHFA